MGKRKGAPLSALFVFGMRVYGDGSQRFTGFYIGIIHADVVTAGVRRFCTQSNLVIEWRYFRYFGKEPIVNPARGIVLVRVRRPHTAYAINIPGIEPKQNASIKEVIFLL